MLNTKLFLKKKKKDLIKFKFINEHICKKNLFLINIKFRVPLLILTYMMKMKKKKKKKKKK